MNDFNKNISRKKYSSLKDDDVFDLRALLMNYLRYWHWFLLSVIFVLSLAFLYLKTQESKYLIQTKILLRGEGSGGISSFDPFEGMGLLGVNRDVEDEMQVLSSNKLIAQFIDSLDLQKRVFEKKEMRYVEGYKEVPFELDISKEELSAVKYRFNFDIKKKKGKYYIKVKVKNKFTQRFVTGSPEEPIETPLGSFKFKQTKEIDDNSKFRIILYPKETLVSQYKSALNIATVNRQTNVIAISLVASNERKAKDVLNSLVEFYNKDANVDKNMIASSTADFINDRLAVITDELFDVELEVESYKKQNKLTDIASESNLFLSSADEYEKKRTELEIQLNMINSVESYINDSSNSNSLLPANIVTNDPTLANSIQQYNAAILEKMKLGGTASDLNPVIKQADEQIMVLRSNVMASVASVKTGLQITLNDLKKKEALFSSKIKNVPTQERQFLEIKRQQEIKQSLYLFLFQKKEENAIKLASTAPPARVIDYAYKMESAVSPKKNIVLLAALMFGLLIPFLLIYLRMLLNNTIDDVKGYQSMVKAPFLGSISISSEKNRLVVEEGKTSPIAETFRLVRTNLQFLISGKKSPVILVTSSFSGEGKSFISLNLAMSFVLTNKKVAIVGLDIRNPVLGRYLNLENGKGATIFLSDETCQLDDITYKSGVHELLDVIPAGPIPPNPSELLMGSRLDELFRLLKEKYDYTIVDSAPIGMVSDTYHINRVVDSSVYVSRQNYTPKAAISLINDAYEDNRLNVMGVVLNGTSGITSYGFEYGYKYRYSSSNRPKVHFTKKIYNYIFRR